MEHDLPMIQWLFGGLLSVVSVLVGIVYRQQQKRFAGLERDIKRILERTDFVQFLAMDKTREVHWMIWRETLDKKMEALAKRMEHTEQQLSRIEGRMTGLGGT